MWNKREEATCMRKAAENMWEEQGAFVVVYGSRDKEKTKPISHNTFI